MCFLAGAAIPPDLHGESSWKRTYGEGVPGRVVRPVYISHMLTPGGGAAVAAFAQP
jgi:hypothetical protein